jgi:PAS domain S-box-containing protein
LSPLADPPETDRVAETLYRIGAALAVELDLQKIVQLVTDEATRLTGGQFGAFFYNLINERGESLLLYTLSGVPREEFSRFPMPRNTAIFDPTFRGEGVVRLDDVTMDPRYGRNAPYRGMPEGHLPVRSYLAVPVVSRSGEVLGGLFFGHAEPGVFTDRRERLVVGIAAQAAVAIDNARLFEQARRTADRLEQQLQFTRAVTESLGEGLYAVDLSGNVTALNPAGERLLGWRAADLVGKNAHDVIHCQKRPDGSPVPAAECPLLGVIRTGAPFQSADDTFARKNGAPLPVAYSSSPVVRNGRVEGAVVVFQDITDRKAADALQARRVKQTALRGEVAAALASDGNLRGVLQHCCDALVRHLDAAFARVWTVDDAGAVLELQASAGLYTHIDGGHARVPVGKFKIGLIAEGRKPHLTNDVLHDPRVGNPEWARREGMVAFAGYPLLVEDRLVGVAALFARQPLPQDSLDWLASVADLIAQGITRRRAEEEVRRLNADLEDRVRARTAELEEANRELESFSYSVSHDLRAPLRHIGGFVQMLEKSSAAKLDAAGRRQLAVIKEAAAQARRMVDELLAFSRMGRADLRRTPVDMNRLVAEVRKEVEPEAQGRPIDWHVGDLPAVPADPAMLRLVWRNLLSNAVKFTRRAEPPRIKIDASVGSAEVVFRVADNGVGFDQQYVGKLFGVFQRLHAGDEFEGTGIGLANVRRIVTRHGGRVWAEGRAGEGATFYVALPRAVPEET